MQQKTANVSFATISMTSTAIIYMTAAQLNTYTSLTPNFTKIGKEIWKERTEIH
jgi:hypothetical protein